MDSTVSEQDRQAEVRKSAKHALIAIAAVVIYEAVDIVLVGGPTPQAYASLTFSLAALGFFASIFTNARHGAVAWRVFSTGLLVLSVILRVIGTWMA